MPLDENFRSITETNGRTTYINLRDIRSFYNYESQLIIEMIDGTVYNVDGAPNVNAFYAATFGLSPLEVTLTDNPLTIDGTIAISSIGGTVATSTTITNNPLITQSTITNNPLNVNVTNNPLEVQEYLTSLTFTTSTVSVTTASTLLLSANADRKLLIIQRGNVIGGAYVKLGSGAATTSNGILMRENSSFILDRRNIYTGEINAIAVGSTKTFHITEAI